MSELPFLNRRDAWLGRANDLEPTIRTKTFPAIARVTPVFDARDWQGCRLTPTATPTDVRISDGPVFLDFGRHLVGTVRFVFDGPASDREIRVRLGEMPAEVCEDPAQFPGKLGGEWLEPVVVTPDEEGVAEVPGRRALRFALIEVTGNGSSAQDLVLRHAEVVAETSATWHDPTTGVTLKPWQRELDRVAIHTLRNCMHRVFEDGPKRDRRLWLGDLYLQAKASYLTFGAHDLVKRCLYLFAGTSGDDGLISPCVFAKPTWHGSHPLIPSYAWLFAPTLLDFAEATGDLDTAADLFDIAAHQQTLFDRHANADGLFDPDDGATWRFVDWNESLDPQIAEQAVAIFSLNALLRLADMIGRSDEKAELASRRDRLVRAARQHLFNKNEGLFVSPATSQVSWASQAWMVLAGVMTGDEARHAMLALYERSDAVPPVTPYMQHYIVEALFVAGLDDLAWQRLRDFWSGMIDHDATTFWELYDPQRPLLSPYKSHLHNSACHAWSCTPSYFIRRDRSSLRDGERASSRFMPAAES